MCGPFKSFGGILRLLEMIFSGGTLVLVLFRGGVASPWGVWCCFVWLFCSFIPLIIAVLEALQVHVLLVAFLPDWADLTCGLTVVCTLTIASASVVYAVVYTCFHCVLSILAVTFSLAATVAFLVDAVLQKLQRPRGYLSRLSGVLRVTEAFVACLLLAAATSSFQLILFNLLSLLRLPLPIKLLQRVYNVVAALLYLSAAVLWAVYGYWRYSDSRLSCSACSLSDLHVVTAGALLNLLLYTLDIVVSFQAR